MDDELVARQRSSGSLYAMQTGLQCEAEEYAYSYVC